MKSEILRAALPADRSLFPLFLKSLRQVEVLEICKTTQTTGIPLVTSAKTVDCERIVSLIISRATRSQAGTIPGPTTHRTEQMSQTPVANFIVETILLKTSTGGHAQTSAVPKFSLPLWLGVLRLVALLFPVPAPDQRLTLSCGAIALQSEAIITRTSATLMIR